MTDPDADLSLAALAGVVLSLLGKSMTPEQLACIADTLDAGAAQSSDPAVIRGMAYIYRSAIDPAFTFAQRRALAGQTAPGPRSLQ